MENKKTLVIGASPNPSRYSYKAVSLLRSYNYPVEALGIKEGQIGDVEIQFGKPELSDIHTVTLYVGPERQPEYYDYILSLNPKRLIFNPGTENIELENLAKQAGIVTIENCTLVMLNTGRF